MTNWVMRKDLLWPVLPLVMVLTLASFVTEAKSIQVGALVSGQVVKVFFNEGDAVKKGELLIMIDDRVYKAELARLKAERDRVAAIFADEEIEMANIEDLFDRTVIAKRPYQQALRNFAVAKANLAIAQAALDAHQAWFDYYYVVAPKNGVIKSLAVGQGSTVFKENDPLFELEVDSE